MTRLPIATDLKTRTGAPSTKDARQVNSYVETKGEQSVVRKRPAAQGGLAIGTGTAQGGIGLTINGTPYFIGFWSDTMQTYTGGGTSWSSSTLYLQGDHVSVGFQDYWAINDNTNSQPPSGNWSSTCYPANYPAYTFKMVAHAQDTLGKYSNNGFSGWSAGTTVIGHWDKQAYSPVLNKFVVISVDGKIATSSDGITWTTGTSPMTQIYGICWSTTLNEFVMSGYGGASAPYYAIATSSNGTSWTLRSTPVNSLISPVWSPALLKYLAVDGAYSIYSSTDGITWSFVVNVGGMSSVQIDQIIWGNGIFVAVGSANGGTNKTFATSTDGISWTAQSSPFDGTGVLSTVAYSSDLNLYAALQWANTSTVNAAYSSDGITWLPASIPAAAYRSLIWSHRLGCFYTNTGYYSTDGITWASAFALNAYVAGSNE